MMQILVSSYAFVATALSCHANKCKVSVRQICHNAAFKTNFYLNDESNYNVQRGRPFWRGFKNTNQTSKTRFFRSVDVLYYFNPVLQRKRSVR